MGTIPAVVVEVPVIPGSLGQMKDLLVRSDALGISGVNLLEFCFPLHNAAEFAKRGFQLRKHPFKYLYNYWYGGGVPVAGSEAEAVAKIQQEINDTPEHFDDDDVVIYSHNVAVADKSDVYL